MNALKRVLIWVLVFTAVFVSISFSYWIGYQNGRKISKRSELVSTDNDSLKEQDKILCERSYYNDKIEESNSNNTVNENVKEYVEIFNKNFNQTAGKVQYGIHIYQSKIRYTNESYKAPSASVIKIFIMEYAYSQMENGLIKSDTMIGGKNLIEMITSMITVSDNNATNALIDYFGMDNLNEFFKKQGYNDTVLERRMLDTAAMKNGRDNYTSANDVMQFLDKLYLGKDKYPYKNMLDIMKAQKIATKIRRRLPANVVIANKTGELSDVENDIGIVFTENDDIAFVFLCNSLRNNASVRDAISNTTYAVYNKLRQK